MSQINIGVDISKADELLKQLNNALANSTDVAGKFTVKMAELDAQGKITRGTLEQLDGQGRKLTATFDVAGGKVENFSSKLTEAGKSGAEAGQSILVSWQGLARVLEVQVFRRGVTAFINATRDGIAAAQEFQVQLQQVGNVTGQAGNLEAFGARIRTLSDQFGTSLGDTLTASQSALTSQLGNSAAGFDVLTAAMQLNRATGVGLVESNRLVTTTLQAFGLASTEAARTANVLFVTAQNVRVPFTEMQQIMQRVGPTAKELGVSIEEVSALFSTISQQGGRPAQAFGQLDQIMARLRQPTDEMRTLLAQLGTTSVEAGVQTFGLVGFLQRLSAVAERAPDSLGSIARPLRTLGIDLALTTENVQRFEQNLQSINNQRLSLFNADRATAQNPAEQLREEMNKIRNVFEVDIGGKLITVFNSIVKGMGGGTEAAKTLVNVIAAATVGMGLFKAATELSSLAMGKLAEGTGTVGDKIKLNTADAANFTNALLASYAAGMLLWSTLDKIERQQEARRTRGVDRNLAQGAEQDVRSRANAQADLEANAAIINRGFQARTDDIARRRQLYDADRQVALDNQRQIQDAYKATAQTYIDQLKRSISEGLQSISQAKSEIEQSKRGQLAFRQQLEAGSFQRRLGIEQDPFAASEMLRQRLARVRAEAERTTTDPTATADQIRNANQQWQEAARLSGELADREREIQLRQNIMTGNLRTRVLFGQEVLVNEVNFNEALAREAQLAAQRDAAESVHRQNVAERREKEIAAVATQQSNLRVFEASLRRIEQFRVTNDQGELAPRFVRAEQQGVRPGGGVRQAQQQFEALVGQIRTAGRAAGLDETAIKTLINQAREGLAGEVALLQRRNQLINEGAENERRRTEALERNVALVEANRAREQQIRDTAIRAQNITERLMLPRTQQAIPAATFTSGGTQANLDEQTGARAINAAITANNEYQASLLQLRTAGGQTTENINRVDAALRAMQTALEGLATVSPRAFRNAGMESMFTGPAAQTIIESVKKSIDTQLVPGQGTPRGLADSLQQNLDQVFRNMQEIQRNNAAAAAAQANNAANPMAQLNVATTNVASTMNTTFTQALVAATGNLNSLALAGPQRQAMADTSGNEEFGTAATGGIARAFPGRPRGTDTVPYWLTPGEYIMDAKSTSKYYTQLVAMSHGTHPGYAAKGGVVVGDIHVTANMNSVNEKSVRQLGRAISREIKRGTISFGQ